ncbi:MAG: winged helix DNA-binding domain-containing protein, partial [Dokdonella sp.]
MDIAHQRLHNQLIEKSPHAMAAEVVGSMVAMQAQDYLGALWAIGLRTRAATERGVEQAVAERRIVRTWPLRGTLHFVAAEDVRWLLELATPRVIEHNRRRLRDEYGVDDKLVARARRVCEKVLSGGRHLTRDQLYAAFDSSRIPTDGQRGLHLLWWLAQQGLVCFGAREGKQQTFVLLDEWLPASRRLSRDAALAELARRYFTRRGPATLQDFTWWSGLAPADASAALEAVTSGLECETFARHRFWFAPQASGKTRARVPRIHLLPAYDEYAVAYCDRSAVLCREYAIRADAGN